MNERLWDMDRLYEIVEDKKITVMILIVLSALFYNMNNKMKISIFTPHKTDYLEELYTNIKKNAPRLGQLYCLIIEQQNQNSIKDKRIIGIKAVAFEEKAKT